QHSIWAMKDGELKEIFSDTTEIRGTNWVGLTPDSRSLAFLATNSETGRLDYFLLNIDSGKVSAPNFGRPDADIEAVIVDRNRVVQGIRYSGFFPSYKFFDSKLDARVQ